MDAQEEWDARRSGVEKLAPAMPQLAEVLRMEDPDQVVERLAMLPKQKERCQKMLQGLVGVLSGALKMDSYYLGGSFSRGTALNFAFDADVVLFLKNFQPKRCKEYQEAGSEVLLYEFYRGIQITGDTPYCIKVIAGRFVRVDVVLTGHPSGSPRQEHARYYSGAGSPDVDKDLLLFAKRHRMWRPLVLLCKLWRHLDTRATGFTSFHIELLCQEVVRRANSGDRLQDLFREFLQAIVREETTVNNPNPYNPDWLQLTSKLARSLPQYAEETGGIFHKYIRPGNNTRCPFCQEQRFTSRTGAVQHLESGSCTSCRGQQKARTAIYDFVRSRPEAQGYLNRMLTDGHSSGRADSGTHLYECPSCGKTFPQLSSLMAHMEAKHGRQARLALGC